MRRPRILFGNWGFRDGLGFSIHNRNPGQLVPRYEGLWRILISHFLPPSPLSLLPSILPFLLPFLPPPLTPLHFPLHLTTKLGKDLVPLLPWFFCLFQSCESWWPCVAACQPSVPAAPWTFISRPSHTNSLVSVFLPERQNLAATTDNIWLTKSQILILTHGRSLLTHFSL